MSTDDTPSFLARVIDGYAEQAVQAGKWHSADAVRFSRNEVHQLLNCGKPDYQDWFLRTLTGSQVIGALWVRVTSSAAGRDAFLCYLETSPEWRGRGCARKALQALDRELWSAGVRSISLHVFPTNRIAWHLYSTCGFRGESNLLRRSLSAACLVAGKSVPLECTPPIAVERCSDDVDRRHAQQR